MFRAHLTPEGGCFTDDRTVIILMLVLEHGACRLIHLDPEPHRLTKLQRCLGFSRTAKRIQYATPSVSLCSLIVSRTLPTLPNRLDVVAGPITSRDLMILQTKNAFKDARKGASHGAYCNRFRRHGITNLRSCSGWFDSSRVPLENPLNSFLEKQPMSGASRLGNASNKDSLAHYTLVSSAIRYSRSASKSSRVSDAA